MTTESAPAPTTTTAPAAATTTTTAPAGTTVDWKAEAEKSAAALASTKAEIPKLVEAATAKAAKDVEDRLKSSLATPEGLSKVLASFAPQAQDPVKAAADAAAALAAEKAANASLRDTASKAMRKTQVDAALIAAGATPKALTHLALDEFAAFELGDDFKIKDRAALDAKAAEFVAANADWLKPAAAAPAAPAQKTGAMPFQVQPNSVPGKQAPIPGTNGNPGPLEVNDGNFLETMGLGPKPTHIKTVRAGIGRQ